MQTFAATSAVRKRISLRSAISGCTIRLQKAVAHRPQTTLSLGSPLAATRDNLIW